MRKNGGRITGSKGRLVIIPTKNSYEFIHTNAISYLSAARSYCQIHLKSGHKLLVSKSLRQMEQELNSALFFRVHHSYLVNVCNVARIIKNEGDCLQLHCGAEIPLAQSRRESFLDYLKEV